MSAACIRCLFSLLLAMRVAALTVDDIQPYFTTIDEIAWIKINSCNEYTSPMYLYETPFVDIPSILDVVDSAIAIKFEPVNKTYATATGTTTTFATYYVESKVCSNPVYCLNHGYELSWVVDVDTSLVTGLRDMDRVRSGLDFYVNSDNEERLQTRVFPDGVSVGGYPRTLTEWVYQGLGSGAEYSFKFDTVCRTYSSHGSHVNPPMEIWLGFDPNGRVCMNNGNGEYVLSTNAPIKAPTQTPTRSPTTSPTTASPTTPSPTTASPTTPSPTTASPTTASPTTASPTTKSPSPAPTKHESFGNHTNYTITIEAPGLSSTQIVAVLKHALNSSSTPLVIVSTNSDDDGGTQLLVAVYVPNDVAVDTHDVEETLREAMVQEYPDVEVRLTVEKDGSVQEQPKQANTFSRGAVIALCVLAVLLQLCAFAGVYFWKFHRSQAKIGAQEPEQIDMANKQPGDGPRIVKVESIEPGGDFLDGDPELQQSASRNVTAGGITDAEDVVDLEEGEFVVNGEDEEDQVTEGNTAN